MCFISKFIEIGPLVPKKILSILPYMDKEAIILTNIILTYFNFQYLKTYMQNLVQNGPLGSEKSQF